MECIRKELNRIYKSIIRKRLFILFFVAITTISTIIVNKVFITPMYEASTVFFLGKVDGEVLENEEKYRGVLEQYVNEINDKKFIANALRNGNVDYNVDEAFKGYKIYPKYKGEELTLKYIDSDIERTQKVMDSITWQFTNNYSKLVDRGNIKIISNNEVSDKAINGVGNSLKYSIPLSLLVAILYCCLISIVEKKNFESKRGE